MPDITKSTRAQLAATIRLLDAHLAPTPDGFWVYADGWNDARIAQEIGVAASSIGQTRRQTHGKVRAHRAPEPAAPAPDARLDKIEARLAAIELITNQLK